MLYRTYLRAYRMLNELKQHTMADNLGVRMATYKAWEYGFNRPRSLRDQQRLEHYFKKSLPEILGPAMVVAGEDEKMEIRSLV